MALRASGIPFYMGTKLPARRHGLVRMLLAALRCCGEGWRQEDMLALVKSGFAPLTEEEAFRLENYALENGIRGTKWDRPFTRGDEAEEMASGSWPPCGSCAGACGRRGTPRPP